MKIKVSPGNSKMGSIKSVSLPSIVTCPSFVPCSIVCYANKLERIRPYVKRAYEINYNILIKDPDTYWREVEASVMTSRFFRFHVSGDIPTPDYLQRMIGVAGRNPHCEILCFTKRYKWVNDALDLLILPKNLHLIFSVWAGYPYENPHRLPEAHVRYKDGSTTASDRAVGCSGNCTECAITDSGCWVLKNGEQVVFNQH